MSTRTFQSVIEETPGFSSGFHLLRLLLAVCVIVAHSAGSSGGEVLNVEMWTHPLRGTLMLVLPMFFAMSGFLMGGSFDRVGSISKFLTLRAMRIFPALIVAVVVCALIIGPAVTSFDLTSYFTHDTFFRYWLNTVGWTHNHLPGVFDSVPDARNVNVSLWTVPWDIACYLLMALAIVLGLYFHRSLLLGCVIVFGLLVHFYGERQPYYPELFGELLILSFFCGLSMYQFRDRIRNSGWLALACGFVAFVCFTWSSSMYLGAPFAAYLTIYLGLKQAPSIPLIMHNDYSYGLYLFGFPLQQLHSHLFPDDRIWYLNALFGLSFGFMAAMLCWHFVEQPINNKRRAIMKGVDGFAISTGLRRARKTVTTKLDRFWAAGSSPS